MRSIPNMVYTELFNFVHISFPSCPCFTRDVSCTCSFVESSSTYPFNNRFAPVVAVVTTFHCRIDE